MQFDLTKVLKEMPKRAYTSEADLQLSIAMQIERCYGVGSAICEYPPNYASCIGERQSRIHIDIMFMGHNEHVPIEIKYRTKKAGCELIAGGVVQSEFTLATQGAHDEGCYGFWKDVCRLQEYKERSNDDKCNSGYAIFVTNDEKYVKDDFKGKPYEEFTLNVRERTERSGRISGKPKTLITPKVDVIMNWDTWIVQGADGEESLRYWCYVAKV